MKNIFTEHPHSIGETYWQHCKFAARFGWEMTRGGLACLTHAIFPFLFPKTASTILLDLSHNVISRMDKTEKSVEALGALIEQKLKTHKDQS